jgi:cytochrome c oxidase subunit 4
MSQAHAEHLGRPHPGPATYAKVAAALCIITLIEFAIYYAQSMRPILVPSLIILSGVKFALVAMFYMHLRFDHPVFTRVLLIGIFLGVSVVLSLMALFFLSHPLAPLPA